MSLPVSSQLDLYTIFKNTMQAAAPDLTDFNDGSICDTEAGVFSVAGNELIRTIILKFNKCFFTTANGPEVTQGPDDLQYLAVDRFGELFKRPGAKKAIDTAVFSRPTNAAGAILIGAGTVVKTQPDSDGNVQTYTTDSDVTLINLNSGAGLSVSVGITAVLEGAKGSAAPGAINVIETSFTDTTITVSNIGNSTGANAQDDATYRQTILNLIQSLSKATTAAIRATALTVTGVVTATPSTTVMTAIQYNPITHATVGNYFFIPKAVLYIADATGTASPALIAAVTEALKPIQAAGVSILVQAATAQEVNWTVSYVLNPSGPNYSVLSNDSSMIVTAMTNYLRNLAVGTDFVRATAMAAVLAIWGPAGSNDLVSMTTSVPSGDVAADTASTKLIPGTMSVV